MFILAIFLLDAHYEVYVWFGWWWKDDYEVANTVATTANSTTGSRVSRWIRDKQLALETAQQYAKGACMCGVRYVCAWGREGIGEADVHRCVLL